MSKSRLDVFKDAFITIVRTILIFRITSTFYIDRK
ncbi:hypothetical protein IGJ34_000048 [Enterococcus sp. AZ177]